MNLFRWKFGQVTFDEARFELVVDGLQVDVQRKPLQVLKLLLRQAGRAVSREEFLREVWGGQPTVDNVLANAIVKLRTALGEAHAAGIENIPRVGYRFTMAVERTLVASHRDEELGLKPGDAVPRRESFRLHRRLGVGGSHEVWLARHAKTAQERVFKFAIGAQALPGLKREVTLSRLLANAHGERVDVVRVLDWNFEQAPYFVESEYGGENLAEWAARDGRLAAMPLSDRLVLFTQIARAVSAAHALAVLHKDLKPGNVLVGGTADGGWQCRLLDFGSGRLLDLARLGEWGITPLGLTVAPGTDSDAGRSTLLYAAPELLGDEPATVRSDIYALGVLLYQIVVGDFRRGLDVGWERDVDDVLLRGDIARATDREPARRFGSVDELAQQLAQLPERHRAQQTADEAARAQAEQQRQLERLRARRPWLHGGIAVLAAGLIAVGLLYARLERSHAQTAAELATSQALARFLTQDLLASADPSVAGRGDVTMAQAARAAAAHADATLAGATAQVRALVHATLQRVFQNQSAFEAATAEGSLALAAWAEAADPDRAETVRIRLARVYPLSVLQRTAEADRELAQAERDLQALGWPAELSARWLFERAGARALRMQLEPALVDDRRAWALAAVPGFADTDLAEKIELATSDLYFMTNQAAESERLARDLLARQEQRWGSASARSCFTRVVLANALGAQQQLDQAVPTAKTAALCLDAALGPDNQRTLDAQRVHANLLMRAQRYDEAAALLADLAGRILKIEGPKSANAVSTEGNRAMALHEAGHVAEAERAFGAALDSRRATFEWTSPLIQWLRYWQARCRVELGSRQGVAQLLDGLQPQQLNTVQIAPDWPQRLAALHVRT